MPCSRWCVGGHPTHANTPGHRSATADAVMVNMDDNSDGRVGFQEVRALHRWHCGPDRPLAEFVSPWPAVCRGGHLHQQPPWAKHPVLQLADPHGGLVLRQAQRRRGDQLAARACACRSSYSRHPRLGWTRQRISYLKAYKFWPPPVLMIIFSIVEIGVRKLSQAVHVPPP
jgi:hypothetical protein